MSLQRRKAALTPTGQLLYRRAKGLVAEAARLERSAAELARGQEPPIRLAVDVIYPIWLLLDCLKAFADEQPDTRIELYETVLGGTDDDADALRLCSDAWLPEDTFRTELAAGRLVRLPLAQGAERHARTRQACEQCRA